MPLTVERIPDQIGSLVLSEDGAILMSTGDLANAEHIANAIYKMISFTDHLGVDDEPYYKLSINFKDFAYVICKSDRRIYIVKRQISVPPTADDELFENSGSLIQI